MSTNSSYLAFDLGASSGRAIVGELSEGRLLMHDVHRFETPLFEKRGHLYWDLDALWDELQIGLRQALRLAPNLRSLSVDSWGVDYVPLNGDGQPVRPAYCYRDPRTDGMMDEAFSKVSAATIYTVTGVQFMQINTLYQILADVEYEPNLVAQTVNRLPIADYFNFCFGGRPVTEVSLASTTQLLDVRRRTWAVELMKAIGLPTSAWPDIVPSGTLLGSAYDAPSVEVVASCSHDTGCAVAAVPADPSDSNWAYISCGTWSLLGVERNKPLVTDSARRAGFTNEAGVDGTVRFLKNLTGLWALQECIREWQIEEPDVYAMLLAAARQAPANSAFINLEDDRFLSRGDMQGRIQAYCREHGLPVPETRGAVTRLILESIADSYRRTIGPLSELLGHDIDVIHIVGGGSQNSLLCQLTADLCGCTVVAGPVEATAMGNLLIQIRTMGDLPEGSTLRDVVRHSFDLATYTPTPTR